MPVSSLNSWRCTFQARLPTAVPAAAVGADQQPLGLAVMPPAVHPPPPPDALDGELRSFMGHSHVDHRPIARDVVRAIGNGFAFRLTRKVVGRNLLRLPSRHPLAARIFKGSHQLLLLCVDRNYWIAAVSKSLYLPVQVAELRVPVGMLGAFPCLHICLQCVSRLGQTSRYCHVADRVPVMRQFLGNGAC